MKNKDNRCAILHFLRHTHNLNIQQNIRKTLYGIGPKEYDVAGDSYIDYYKS